MAGLKVVIVGVSNGFKKVEALKTGCEIVNQPIAAVVCFSSSSNICSSLTLAKRGLDSHDEPERAIKETVCPSRFLVLSSMRARRREPLVEMRAGPLLGWYWCDEPRSPIFGVDGVPNSSSSSASLSAVSLRARSPGVIAEGATATVGLNVWWSRTTIPMFLKGSSRALSEKTDVVLEMGEPLWMTISAEAVQSRFLLAPRANNSDGE